MMKHARLHLTIPEDMVVFLKREAKARKTNVSELVSRCVFFRHADGALEIRDPWRK